MIDLGMTVWEGDQGKWICKENLLVVGLKKSERNIARGDSLRVGIRWGPGRKYDDGIRGVHHCDGDHGGRNGVKEVVHEGIPDDVVGERYSVVEV